MPPLRQITLWLRRRFSCVHRPARSGQANDGDTATPFSVFRARRLSNPAFFEHIDEQRHRRCKHRPDSNPESIELAAAWHSAWHASWHSAWHASWHASVRSCRRSWPFIAEGVVPQTSSPITHTFSGPPQDLLLTSSGANRQTVRHLPSSMLDPFVDWAGTFMPGSMGLLLA